MGNELPLLWFLGNRWELVEIGDQLGKLDENWAISTLILSRR